MAERTTSSDSASRAADQATREASTKMREVGEQVRESSRQLADQARDQAATLFEAQKRRAVDELSAVADVLRQSGSRLDREGRASSGLIQTAADGIERFSNSLEDKDLRGLIDDSQRFARNSPALFLGAAAALGFLAARFLKSAPPTDEGYDPRTVRRDGTVPHGFVTYGEDI